MRVLFRKEGVGWESLEGGSGGGWGDQFGVVECVSYTL